MLKRLLTAVLILAIFMVFTGTAFSAPGNVPHKAIGAANKLSGSARVMPNARLLPFMTNQANNRVVVPVADNSSVTPLSHPVVNGADTNACYYQDLFTPFATGAYRIDMYDASGPFPLEGMTTRMSVFAPNHAAVVDTVFGIVRFASHLGGAGCPVEVTVWSDLGGAPNALLYSATYSLPKVTGATWFKFALPTSVTINGTSYHVGLRVPTSQVVGDSLSFRISSNAAASAVSHYEAGTTIYGMNDVFASGELMMAVYSHHCEHYTQCYTNNPIPAPGYVYAPVDLANTFTDGSLFQGYAQRFIASGKETLKTVQVIHTSYGGSYPGLLYDSSKTASFEVSILKDNGLGEIDTTAAPLATVTLPGGPSLFPTTGLYADGFNLINVDFSAFNLVLFGAYHVAVKLTSSNPADGYLELNVTYEVTGSFYTDGTGASVAFTAPGKKWQRTGNSASWLADGTGVEEAFLVRPVLCRDEFSVCTAYTTSLSPAYAFRFDGVNFDKVAQRIKANDVNRIDGIKFYTSRGANPIANFIMDVYADTGATAPGALITSYTVTRTAGWTSYVIPGGLQVLNNFWVGYRPTSFPPSVGDTLKFVTDDGTFGYNFGGALMDDATGGGWGTGEDWFGPGYQFNLVAEVDFCSLPPTIWPCGPLDNYATSNHDYGRTSHSNVSLSDAYCDLTVKWGYTDTQFGTTTGAMASAAPIVWNNYVVCMFGTKYVILDATTGALLQTITGSGAPNFITGTGSLHCTPTIAKITISGTPTNVLFIAGGSTQSLAAYDMDTPGFPQIWSVNSGNRAAKGYPGSLGDDSYANFVTLTIAGTDYLFFATSGGRLYAANATTGQMIWGPVTLDGFPNRGLATDGTKLYLCTNAVVPSNPEGDVYAINAATGAILWQLSTAGGLKGQTVYGAAAVANETFPHALAYSNGELYTMSGFVTVNTFPGDGVFYRIAAASGAVLSAVPGQSVYQGSGSFNTGGPSLDVTKVYVAGSSAWTTPSLGGKLLTYNRLTGLLISGTSSGNPPAATYYAMYADGAMSCENGVRPDWLIQTNSQGYVSFFQNGDEKFSRRMDFGATNPRGAGVAIGNDTSVYVGAYFGAVYKLTKQADRPRLEIVNYNPSGNTYGSLPSVIIPFGKVFTNTGCGALTGTIQIDEFSNGALLGAPAGPSIFDQNRAASVADGLTSGATAFGKASLEVDQIVPTDLESNRTVNRAATALPSFINAPSQFIPFTLNPGDTFSLSLDVKQSAISRGPNVCWGWVSSNDPDFFISNTAEVPQMKITIVGGCVIDTTDLTFGAGGANVQKVTNSGRLGTGDWTPHGFKIDANVDDFYQGAYLYGVSSHRIAVSSQDWWSGGGEVDAWTSMQGDPNACTNDCKPALQTAVPLGSISSDGLTYTALTGRVVCRTFLDSVQNFGTTLANWSWIKYSAAPFDPDSTMGMMVNSRTFAVTSAPAAYSYLNNVTVDNMKIWQRYNLPVNNWKMSLVTDYDLGGDTVAFHPEISAAWSVPTARPNGAWGIVKLPFGGCGTSTYAPLKNVKALAREQSVGSTKSQATAHGNAWLDSAYIWMNQGAGSTSQGAVSAAGDQDFFATFAEHDFTANDTLQIALAEFGFPNLASPTLASNIAPLANTLNKWVGFGRGDVNNDGVINLADIVYLAKYINVGGSPGPIPFLHTGDVDGNGSINAADVTYLIGYYFYYGPCPVGKFINY